MRLLRQVTGPAFLLIGLLLAGCGGGEVQTSSEISTTTTGQQLMDLKKALDSGAISQDEYAQQRERILEGE